MPVGPKTAEAIKAYIKGTRDRREGPDGRLFVTYRREAMVYSALNAMLGNLGKYAGVEHCIPHRFRHTFAVTDYRANRDLMGVRNRLGHSKVETTQRYLESLGADYGSVEEKYQAPDAIYG